MAGFVSRKGIAKQTNQLFFKAIFITAIRAVAMVVAGCGRKSKQI
jgi:hypothetical protein